MFKQMLKIVSEAVLLTLLLICVYFWLYVTAADDQEDAAKMSDHGTVSKW